MAMLHRIAAAASWAVFGTMATWLLLMCGGPPNGLAEFAARLRSIEPRWLWSAGWPFAWYEVLCVLVLSLWLSSRPADRPGMYRGGGFWLAVLNPFWPWLVAFALMVAGVLWPIRQ
jgi:hypothetical protein